MAAFGTVVRRSMTLAGGLRPSEVGQGRRTNRISSVHWPSSGGLLHCWMLGSSRVPCMVWSPGCTITVIGLKVARWSLTSVRPTPYHGLVYHWMLGWVCARVSTDHRMLGSGFNTRTMYGMTPACTITIACWVSPAPIGC